MEHLLISSFLASIADETIKKLGKEGVRSLLAVPIRWV
jgi:hypothetical protein